MCGGLGHVGARVKDWVCCSWEIFGKNAGIIINGRINGDIWKNFSRASSTAGLCIA